MKKLLSNKIGEALLNTAFGLLLIYCLLVALQYISAALY